MARAQIVFLVLLFGFTVVSASHTHFRSHQRTCIVDSPNYWGTKVYTVKGVVAWSVCDLDGAELLSAKDNVIDLTTLKNNIVYVLFLRYEDGRTLKQKVFIKD